MTVQVQLHSRKYPGLFALVDEGDVELVTGYTWCVLWQLGGAKRYAVEAWGEFARVNGC